MNATSVTSGTRKRLDRRQLLSLAAAGGVSAALPGLIGTRAVDAAAASAVSNASLMQGTGGTLALAMNAVSDIKNFNQAIVYDSASWFPSTCIFSRLTVMDYGPDFEIHPQLAHEWTVSDDARVYTFNMVDNARWHDGEPVTSADVKMTFEGIVEQEGPSAAFLSGIESIETPDDYTVIMTLKESDASFLYSISVYPRMPILPRHLYEGTDWLNHPNNLNPIGSGPFKFQELTPGDRFILVANDDYFEGRPNLDMVVGKFIPDQRTALAALQAGEYGALNGPPPLQLIHELQANPNLAIEAPPGPWGFYIGFNMTKAPLDNVEVRQALATAINRDDVTTKVTGGIAPVSNGPYVQGIEWAFDPSVKSPAFDPAKAEEMLDAAGLERDGDGVRARFRLFAISDELYPLVAEVVKEHLRTIGVEVEIQLMDNPTFHEVMPRLEHDLVAYALWIGPDPNEWKQQLLKDGFRNWFGYDNPEVAELFAEGVRSPDREVRKVSYYKIQEIVNRDMPRINLFDAPYSFAHTTAYEGFFSQEGFISYRMDLTKVTQVR
jgi:peptide/nickel transport system substrate-binding protein